MILNSPPKTIEELKYRIDMISGVSLGELAQQLNVISPQDLQIEKGWSGQLLEAYLGTTAGNLSLPDFVELDIELKTIPIDITGKVLESTFVCVASLTKSNNLDWHQSSVYNKLKHVLWVPIIASRDIPVPDRQIATPFLWQMPTHIENELKTDWQELTDMIVFGQHEQISAKHGKYLQLRPKAANGSVRTKAFDKNGKPTLAQPKGFYLRALFTQSILNEQFKL